MRISQKEIKNYLKEIEMIDKKFREVISHLNTTTPKFTNSDKEKEMFFRKLADDEEYNPKFKFRIRKYDEDKIRELKNFEINLENDYYGIKKLYHDKKEEKLLKIKMIQSWGNPESTKYSIQIHGTPSWFLLRKAKKFCMEYSRHRVKFRRLSPKKIGIELKAEVKRLTGMNVSIQYAALANKLNIKPSSNIIMINPHERFTNRDLKRLLVHEIGTHYMRFWNGRKTGLSIFEIGCSGYIETEEGLAAFMEEKYKVSSNSQMYIYAGRVIATYYSSSNTFFEVFKILKKYGFKDEDAYSLTLRAKRNLKDSSEKGGYIKDYVYFSGYHKVKKFAKNKDIKDLFIGKIKISDMKLLKKYIENRREEIEIYEPSINLHKI